MWLEVLIAVLFLIYVYKIGIENLSITDIIRLLFIILIPIMVYHFVKEYN